MTTKSMIFEHTRVFNLDGAFRGMRNPKDSWDRSDSYTYGDLLVLGENDKALAETLIDGGPTHRKFLRHVFVCVDITAPRYWWQEFDTYRFGVERDSCSTMHKIMAYPITIERFAIDDEDLEDPYESNRWSSVIADLNKLRQQYLETKEFKYFLRLKRRLPESFLQKRTITMSYEAIHHMIEDRKTHRLPEWREDYIKWAHTLPYAKELLFDEDR